MKKPKIAAAVAAGQARKLDELDLTAKRVLSEVMALGFLDVGELFDEHGKLRPMRELPKEVRKAIASLEVVKRNLTAGDDKQDEIIKLRLWTRQKHLRCSASISAYSRSKSSTPGELRSVGKAPNNCTLHAACMGQDIP